MKVLIIHQHFNTPEEGGPLRSYYLAKALVEKGIQAVVITAKNQKHRGVENCEGIEIHTLPVAYDNSFGFYRRSLSFVQFALGAVRLAGKIRNVTFCYAMSVPLTVGISARWIQRIHKIPFFFEVGDLWPDAPVQLGFINNAFLKQFLYWQENSIYKNAYGVVALSEPIKEAITRKVPGANVTVIPNMADTRFFEALTGDRSARSKYGISNGFTVSYIGAVGFANGLEFFIECARASAQAGLPVRFVICGSGALLNQLKEVSKNLGLNNLHFVPFQDRNGVRELLNLSDASFICYKPFPILETGSPNKYFDGLAAGKLIVVNFQGWIREEIEREQCGVYIDQRNPSDFIAKVAPFLNDTAKLNLFQKNARTLAEKKYSRKVLGEKFTSLFSSTIG